MKLRFLALLSFAVALVGIAQAQNPQRTVEAQTPDVQTQTYEKDGKMVTERMTTTRVREVEAVDLPKTYKAAIFVANRAGAEYDEKIMAMEDLITARITDFGFQVLSREVIANALTSFDPVVASAPRPADSLDAKLTNESSALRLGQNLGADYLLIATISSIGAKSRTVNAYGVSMVNLESNLRATYKVIDGNTGATLTADVVKATSNSRQTANARDDSNDDWINDLVDNAAEQLAGSLQKRVAARKIAAPSAAAGLAEITINVEAADLMIPDVRIGDENTVTISESKFKVSPLNVVVELDGVAIGSAPGKVTLRPGFSKLRLTREGFRTWERTINAVNGQTLNVAMQMSDEGLARWAAATAFINELKNDAKLTDAHVKRLEGIAEMYRNSGIKINTTEGITIKHNSIFN